MSDIIQLLPDSVASQIAAGEVVQRPASIVKELLENAIDSGATSIQLILKDAGRTLVRVVDNGCGMSETDARMCFERHATSKIKKAEDIFRIHTMGFRGEALAAIAAVAQIELKTRRHEDELATQIQIEGSEIVSQQNTSAPAGTSIAVKNIFFNIPARRNFLKSDRIELRHSLEEFQRIALSYPDISFSMIHNDVEIHALRESNLKQRIVSLLGTSFNETLLALEEETEFVKLSGFVGKPQSAKRTRGEQYFTVNKRFIKDPYLNHAVHKAYDGMVAEGSFLPYLINISIDPSRIDVNIHPTKTEIKFDQDQLLYSIMHAAVKKALGVHILAPAIDFDTEKSVNIAPLPPGSKIETPPIYVNTDYNPFERQKSTFAAPSRGGGSYDQYSFINRFNNASPEEAGSFLQSVEGINKDVSSESTSEWDFDSIDAWKYLSVSKNIAVASTGSAMLLLNMVLIKERIIYERTLKSLVAQKASSQRLLYPISFETTAEQELLLNELHALLGYVGFEISSLGKRTFSLIGVPADMLNANEYDLQEIVELYKHNNTQLKSSSSEAIARSMAQQAATKSQQSFLTENEIRSLMKELLQCKIPQFSPSGKKTYTGLNDAQLQKLFI